MFTDEWRKAKGQSLVEMALIVPLLAFIFVGLIEVGWAISGYLMILGDSREVARFGAREKVWDAQDPAASYARMKAHFDAIQMHGAHSHYTVDGESPTATLYISIYEVWTGQACSVQPCPENCDVLTDVFTADDQLWSFLEDPTWQKRYGLAQPSQDEPTEILADMRQAGTRLQCLREKRDTEVAAYSDAAVRVEILYDQPQLINMPILNMVGPAHLRVHTQMRISQVGGER
jgi:TadE-like protein